MGKNSDRRKSEEFKKYILDHYSLNEVTGEITLKGSYARLKIEIVHKKQTVTMTYAHLVFFLKNKNWPKEGMHIDHKDDNPFNNHPDNLIELTVKENHAKRRGKSNGQYGRGKYGYGIWVQYDKKKKYYSALRRPPMSEYDNNRKIYVGCSKNLKELELKIENHIQSIKDPTWGLPI